VEVYTGSYILYYREFDSVTIQEYKEKLIVGINDTNGLGGMYPQGERKIRYDKICKKNNDLTYNRISKHYNIDALARTGLWFSAVDIAHIDVITNGNFDENHPEGSSLNDIVTVVGVSPKGFIDSGYQSRFDWTNDTPEDFKTIYPEFLWKMAEATPNPDNNPECNLWDYYPDYFPIVKTLADLTPNDLALSRVFEYCKFKCYYEDAICFLVFEKTPAEASSMDMTITIGMSDGRIFSQTVTKHF
jgi:hypothetical protein